LIFLVDECVDQPVAERLRRDGHQVLFVSETGPGVPDDTVLSGAGARAAVLVTADKDFGELVFRDRRAAHGVLLVRLAGLSPRAKAEAVSEAVGDRGREMPGAFTVISPGMIRIRRVI
jgi:predicted nuclease of predicted toxin-antitoxin system